MNRYIVQFGWDEEAAIVYAPSLDAARMKAVQFSIAKGLSAEDAGDPDVSCAREFDTWLAKDLGLMWLDERETGWHTAEARQTP